MSTQPLFDKVFSGTPEPTGPRLTGKDLRDSGIQQALDHVERVKAEYIDSCLDKIRDMNKGALLTSEDLREMAGNPPEGCENAVAGILLRARSRGLIANTGEKSDLRNGQQYTPRNFVSG